MTISGKEMSINKKVIDLYISNLDENGKRIAKLKWLEEKYNIKQATFTKVSGIRKRCTEEQFQIFVECMRSEETVLLSNNSSSHNIAHIDVLLRQGNYIVGKGKSATTTNVRHDRSCVYILKSGNYYKIGVTLDTSIIKRVQQLQIGNPIRIELLSKTGTIPNAYEIEKQLHKKYKNNRVRGEWLTLSNEELSEVFSVIK